MITNTVTSQKEEIKEYKGLSKREKALFINIKACRYDGLKNLTLDDLYLSDANGKSLFNWARRRGDQQILDHIFRIFLENFYIEGKLDIEKKDPAGRNLIHLAILCQQSADTIVELMNNGYVKSHINQKDNEGFTPLNHALNQRQLAYINQLIKYGADLNQKSKLGTPLFLAAKHGYAEAVKNLLLNNADANQMNFCSTPLYTAVINGHVEIVKLLLEGNADPNLLSFFKLTALDAATECIENKNITDDARQRYMNIITLLKAYGATENSTVSDRLWEIMYEYGYANHIQRDGVCYGLNSLGMLLMFEGEKGIEKSKKFFNTITIYQKDELKSNIDQAYEISTKYIKENKGRITEKFNYISIDALLKIPELNNKKFQRKFKFVEGFTFDDNNFFDRLSTILNGDHSIIRDEIIKRLKDHLIQKQLDKEINEELSKSFTHDGLYFLQIKAELETISLFQASNFYNHLCEEEVANKLPNIQNAYPFFDIVSNEELADKWISKIATLLNLNTNEYLNTFLNILDSKFREYSEHNLKHTIGFTMSSKDHSISFGFNPEMGQWIFCDYGALTVAADLEDLKNGIANSFRGTKAIQTEIFGAIEDEQEISRRMQELNTNLSWKRIHTINYKTNHYFSDLIYRGDKETHSILKKNSNILIKNWKSLLFFTTVSCLFMAGMLFSFGMIVMPLIFSACIMGTIVAAIKNREYSENKITQNNAEVNDLVSKNIKEKYTTTTQVVRSLNTEAKDIQQNHDKCDSIPERSNDVIPNSTIGASVESDEGQQVSVIPRMRA